MDSDRDTVLYFLHGKMQNTDIQQTLEFKLENCRVWWIRAGGARVLANCSNSRL